MSQRDLPVILRKTFRNHVNNEHGWRGSAAKLLTVVSPHKKRFSLSVRGLFEMLAITNDWDVYGVNSSL